MQDFARDEEGLLEQGDLRGAAILNADFWLESPEPRERVIEMQERAFELEAESEAEEDRAGGDRARRRSPRGRSSASASSTSATSTRSPSGWRARSRSARRGDPGAGHLPSLERPERPAASVICRFLRI